jgi:hypothetical protein
MPGALAKRVEARTESIAVFHFPPSVLSRRRRVGMTDRGRLMVETRLSRDWV